MKFLKQILKHPAFIWLFVAILFLYVTSGIVLVGLGYNLMNLGWFFLLYLLLPLIFLVIHSVVVLSFSRAVVFLLFASVLGYIVEWAGIQNGIIFGSRYTYEATHFMLYGVPLAIPLYWAALTYTSYSVVNAFLKWKGKEKPTSAKNDFFLLLLLIVADCIVIFSIDLLIDPIAVAFGAWKWENGGQFFGVPMGNFFGWLLMSFMIIGTFRIFEFIRPKQHLYKSSLLLIPVFAYGILEILLIIQALQLRLWQPALFGSVLFLAIFVAHWMLFMRWLRVKYPKERLLEVGESGYFKRLVKEMLQK